MVKNGGKILIGILVSLGIIVWSGVAYIAGTELLPGKAEELYDCTIIARIDYSPLRLGSGWDVDNDIDVSCGKSSIVSLLSKKALRFSFMSVLYWDDHVIKVCVEDVCQKNVVDIERFGETREVTHVFKKIPRGMHTGRVIVVNPGNVVLVEKAFEVDAS